MTRTVRTAAALAIALPLAATAQVRPADLQRGLVASYALDGDAADAVTRSRAAPVATRPVEDRNGVRNGALWFDGGRSYVNLGAALQPARFTLAAWVRPDANDRVMVIVSKIRNLPGHYQKNLEFRIDPGGRLFLHVPSGQGWEAVTGTTPVPAGRWTHVAATYDGARAQLYVDGARDGQPFPARYEQTRTDTWIGARPEAGTPPGPTFFFFGAMEDVRIWDRALSDVELAAVARGPAQAPAPPPAPPPFAGGPGPRQARPIAIYPLDGDGREALNGANAQLVGAKPGEDRAGNPRGAIALAGKDYVDLGTRTEPERFTLSVWVRPTKANKEQVIFSKLSTNPDARERWLELKLDPFGRVVLRFPSVTGFDASVATDQRLVSSRWTLVTATYDGDQAVLYLDGELAGQERVAPFDASPGPAYLGARPDPQGRRARFGMPFQGRLDDLRIFRGAIDQDEVVALAGEQPRPAGRGGDDDQENALLLRADRALMMYDAACVAGDPQRIAKAEERISADLQDGVRAARPERDVAERVRYAVRELETGRGRFDPASLDKKRGTLHQLSEALWSDLARSMGEQARRYPVSDERGPDDRGRW